MSSNTAAFVAPGAVRTNGNTFLPSVSKPAFSSTPKRVYATSNHRVVQCKIDSNPPREWTRRAVLSLMAAALASNAIPQADADQMIIEPYDAIKSRRYVEIGRPPPDRPAPKFVSGKPVFNIDDELKAQDVSPGEGDYVDNSTLVVARWISVLDDGTTVDDANERQPAIFRPGAHQVPPGIEDGIVGMRTGGVRRISATAERMLT